VPVNWRTVTLENAKRAVKAYNDGSYGCLKNPALDKRALEMFADGLGITSGKVLRQVEFIGKDYGGVAGQPSAIKLAPDIAADIFKDRERYEQVAYSAKPLLQEVPSRSTIEVLYRPFMKSHNNCRNWQVWGTKFWHFLNPDAFPIADSRVNKFFQISQPNSVDTYLDVATRFRNFELMHQEWLPPLREVDGGLSWCDNKLWDKMCYGLAELQ
jgi:hypothetical protein